MHRPVRLIDDGDVAGLELVPAARAVGLRVPDAQLAAIEIEELANPLVDRPDDIEAGGELRLGL